MVVIPIARQLPILIFISLDGFKHEYLSPTYAPNLFALSSKSTVGHMESMYITKTFPNHFSMVTGLYEDEHEVINNKMFDPRLNATFKKEITSARWWNFNDNTIPIWTANELFGSKLNQKRYSASMMYPGSSTSYLNILPTHLQNYRKKSNFTENIDMAVSWLIDREKPANLLTLYFDEPDTTAHLHGPWGQKTLDAVRRVDGAVDHLIKRLTEVDLIDNANLIFVSDHGMAEIKNRVYLSEIIDISNFDVYGSSPDWSVFVKPEKRHLKKKIFDDLLAVSKKNHFRVYKREDIPPELHYSKTVRVGDYFILVDENYDMFVKRMPNVTIPNIWGNHGWKPSNRDMRPLFMAHGPSFKKDHNHAEVFPNIDLFPLMVRLLGLPAEALPNNGSLARIIDVIEPNSLNTMLETIFFPLITLVLQSTTSR